MAESKVLSSYTASDGSRFCWKVTCGRALQGWYNTFDSANQDGEALCVF